MVTGISNYVVAPNYLTLVTIIIKQFIKVYVLIIHTELV